MENAIINEDEVGSSGAFAGSSAFQQLVEEKKRNGAGWEVEFVVSKLPEPDVPELDPLEPDSPEPGASEPDDPPEEPPDSAGGAEPPPELEVPSLPVGAPLPASSGPGVPSKSIGPDSEPLDPELPLELDSEPLDSPPPDSAGGDPPAVPEPSLASPAWVPFPTWVPDGASEATPTGGWVTPIDGSGPAGSPAGEGVVTGFGAFALDLEHLDQVCAPRRSAWRGLR